MSKTQKRNSRRRALKSSDVVKENSLSGDGMLLGVDMIVDGEDSLHNRPDMDLLCAPCVPTSSFSPLMSECRRSTCEDCCEDDDLF